MRQANFYAIPLTALMLAACATPQMPGATWRLSVQQVGQVKLFVPMGDLQAGLEQTMRGLQAVDDQQQQFSTSSRLIRGIRLQVLGGQTYNVTNLDPYHNPNPEEHAAGGDTTGFYDKVDGTLPVGGLTYPQTFLVTRNMASGGLTGAEIVAPATPNTVGVIVATALDSGNNPIPGARVQGYYLAADGQQNVTVRCNWHQAPVADVAAHLRAFAADTGLTESQRANATAALATLNNAGSEVLLAALRTKFDGFTGFDAGGRVEPYVDNAMKFDTAHPSRLDTAAYAATLRDALNGVGEGDRTATLNTAIAGLTSNAVAGVTIPANTLRIVDGDGQPIPGVFIDLFTGDPASAPLLNKKVDGEGRVDVAIAGVTPLTVPALRAPGDTAPATYTVRARLRNANGTGFTVGTVGTATLDPASLPGTLDVKFTQTIPDPNVVASVGGYAENFRRTGSDGTAVDATVGWVDNVQPANRRTISGGKVRAVLGADPDGAGAVVGLGLADATLNFRLMGGEVLNGLAEEITFWRDGLIEFDANGAQAPDFGEERGIGDEFRNRKLIAPFWSSLSLNSVAPDGTPEGLYVSTANLDGAVGNDAVVATWVGRQQNTADAGIIQVQAILRLSNHATVNPGLRTFARHHMVQFNYRLRSSSGYATVNQPYLIGFSDGATATGRKMASGSMFTYNTGTEVVNQQTGSFSYPPSFARQTVNGYVSRLIYFFQSTTDGGV